jgi:asparagine synthase (glutamine-hydrolysing)
VGAVYGHSGRADAALLERMRALVRHRLADAARTEPPAEHLGPTAGFGAGAAPASADPRVACALDGYVLNAAALRAELAAAGVHSPAGDDAALAANLFVRHGTAAWERLDGAFALALVAADGTLHLVRDAIGEKPLYWTRLAGGTVLFASEAKAFLADPRFRAEPDPASLLKVLVFSFVPGEPSAFRGVRELLPGHALALPPAAAAGATPPEPRAAAYWDLAGDVQDWSEERSVGEVGAAVHAAVARRLPAAGAPVAAFLSGGVDSSAVVALLAELGANVTAWSLAFGEGHENELTYAKRVVQHTGVPHRLVDIGPDTFVNLLPAVVWHTDDPLCDCITVPNYLLAREAARETRVVFNGEGGDPLFGGPKNKFLILGEWYRFLGGYDRARAYLASYHKLYDQLDAALTPDFLAAGGGAAALEAFARPWMENPRMEAFLDKLMYANVKLKGGQNILVKVDKMLAANGVQPRSPLFDRALAALAFRLPPAHKRHGDVEKWAFKRAMETKLPRAVIYRKKAGMGVPLNHWFAFTRLGDYARDLLLSKRCLERGYWRREFLVDLLEGRGPGLHVGKDRSGELLWMFVAIELWHRLYLEGERP